MDKTTFIKQARALIKEYHITDDNDKIINLGYHNDFGEHAISFLIITNSCCMKKIYVASSETYGLAMRVDTVEFKELIDYHFYDAETFVRTM